MKSCLCAFLLQDHVSNAPFGVGSVVRGEMKNFNTLEGFKLEDKQALCDAAGAALLENIESGAAEQNPALLSRFLLLTHADIKKWIFYYWFCFPTPVTETQAALIGAPEPLASALGPNAYPELLNGALYLGNPEFFLVRKTSHGLVECGPLGTHGEWAAAAASGAEILLAFVDPSGVDGAPSASLRNLLLLASHRWGLTEARVVCLRGPANSCVLRMSLPRVAAGPARPQSTGWEANSKGRAGPRLVDLGATMDPARLAESSVDLNLKLMKWRLLPELNTELIASQRCLLLGAGTLGCNVARTLMAWGVRHITFVDNGKVSFSNPVRQSLFSYQDCLNGGRPKAEAAAERLKEIFPAMVTEGHTLSIPMAGHAVETDAQREEVTRDVGTLVELFGRHDVVFLLTDSRESRWLPTLLGHSLHVPVLNAAMAFDSYLVMRHGAPSDQPGHAAEFGCYFCSDVVAPVDSLSNRSLDQQCTVTRPGLSYITSATCVELFVSLLHHPMGFKAPSETSKPSAGAASSGGSPLGILPQTIRGSLAQHSTFLGTVQG